MADSLFVPSGDLWLPTELSRGPWSPHALHGGPVAALLVRAAEQVPSDGPMPVARVTVELLRPVPLSPLSVRSRVARPGRKVQLAEISLHAGESEVARATVLRIRHFDLAIPPGAAALAGGAPIEAPDDLARTQPAWVEGGDAPLAFHSHATEHRVVRGSWGEPGPIVDWIRLRVPVVPGESPSPAQRVAAVADFGNGISSVLPFDRYVFINPDLTIHLNRMPEGEWICLDAATHLGDRGAGLAESALYDRRGRIGRAVQSLILDRR